MKQPRCGDMSWGSSRAAAHGGGCVLGIAPRTVQGTLMKPLLLQRWNVPALLSEKGPLACIKDQTLGKAAVSGLGFAHSHHHLFLLN